MIFGDIWGGDVCGVGYVNGIGGGDTLTMTYRIPPNKFFGPPQIFRRSLPPQIPPVHHHVCPPIPPVEVPISALNCAAQQKFGNFEPENAKVIAGGNSFLPLVP